MRGIQREQLTGRGVVSVTEGKPAFLPGLMGEGEPVKKPRKRPMVAAHWAIEFTVPVQVVSEANRRDHWAVRRKRFQDQAATLFAVWCSSPTPFGVAKPLRITFTRLGPQKLDSDNLAGAFKAMRDEVARRIGLDDGDNGLTWVYEQEASKEHGVRVRIEKA